MAEIPTISVVIPLYNKGPYIARALNSVLSQTLQNFEIIVIDDGSTDNGAVIVREFEDPRILFIQQENRGVSAARNRGIEEARAELVAFLDADDEWLPKHIEVLLKLCKRYPKAGAYGTAFLKKIKESATYVEPIIKGVPMEPWEGLVPSYFKSITQSDCIICSSTVAIPKHILREMGGFKIGTWWGEDTDLWGRIALKYPIAFSWDGKAIYHADASNRTSERIESVIVDIFVTYAQKALQAREVPSELKQDILEYVAFKQIQTARRNLEAGRPDLARRNLRNCRTRNLRKSKYWTIFCACVPLRMFILIKNVRSKMMK